MLNGFMNRNGPNGWEAVLYNPNKQLGTLPQNSELFEVLRQSADLLMSGKASGTVCGSTREFKIKRNPETGIRSLHIPLVGVSWLLSENHTPGHRSAIRLAMFLDFEFPELTQSEGVEYESDSAEDQSRI